MYHLHSVNAVVQKQSKTQVASLLFVTAFVIVGSGRIFLVGWGFVTGIFYLLFFLMIIILFMVQWTKELCNLLPNVQFIHIFHLLKLYLLSSIP